MAVVSAGTVTVDFAVDAARARTQLTQFQNSLKKVESGFSQLGAAARALGGILSVGFAINFVRNAAQLADELGKMSDKLGLTTERLRAFQEAAEDAGISQEALNKTLTDSQRRLGEAAAGRGDALKFIQELGLNIRELQTLSPDELFLRYSDAIGQLNSRSAQFAAAQGLFGRSAQEAFNLIREGRPAIEQATRDVEALGLALSRVEVAQIESARRSMDDLADSATVFGQRIAIAVAPFIDSFVESIKEGGSSAEELQSTLNNLVIAGVAVFAALANGARTLEAAFFGLAAANARVLQALTFGDVSEAFKASFEENLERAKNALDRIESIAQAIERIQTSISKSKDAAEQKARDEIGKQQQLALDAQIESARLLAEQAAAQRLNDEIAQMQFAFEAKLELTKSLEAQITDTIAEEQKKRLALSIEAETQRMEASLAAEQVSQDARENTFNSAMGLLRALAVRSKTAAIALIAINRGQQVAQAIMYALAGANLQLTTGDPYTAVARAAAVKAWGFANAALIAATGFQEARNVTSGAGGGLPLGSPHNPIFTQSGDQPAFGATSQRAVQVIISGNVGWDQRIIDELLAAIREATDDRDVIIFGPNSLQAQQTVTTR